MSSNNNDFPYFNGVGTAGTSSKTIPLQTIPKSKKNKHWEKATMEALYSEAVNQMSKNFVFADIRRMQNGEFTYAAVDIEHTFAENPWVEKQAKQLGKDVYVPTHIKHFDFIGIIVNAITGIYSELDNLYRVESIDEYFTNEYIRERTEGLNKYAQAVFKAEIDRMLITNGLNPNKQDFQSQEEAQQYQAQLDAEIKRYSPAEVEKNLSKNFKVLATEWANNILIADEKRFDLSLQDKKCLVDFILTGRWFRHYKVGYDYYDIEHWLPEEVFFSQDLDSQYPQDLDYIGKLTRMSSNQVLMRYGFLMNTSQQELVGNYWNQDKTFKSGSSEGTGTIKEAVFSQARVVPFANYYDHQTNLQMENALGVPLAKSMDENGNVSRHWMPRMDNDIMSHNSSAYSKFLRDDIDVRTDTIEVMDVYWRSMKQIGILIYENEMGNPEVEVTTEDLLPEFLEEEEIKKLKTVSMQELQRALKENTLIDYINTISYHYVPEIWHGVMVKGNNSTIKGDMFLDVRPLDYQIKGDSNLYQVRMPVGGLISNGLIPKILPYQQLHNICMNQNSELLAKESKLGVFFSIDINSLPAEYKDETTEEALYAITDTIQNTGILPLDPSRSNTQGSTVYPNIFQRNEVTFANQIQYRQLLAEYYKQQAYNQIGITAQVLGQPNTYVTAEGVKQGAQASYALMNGMIEDFNTAKAKANEIHLAVAQFCEVNGQDTTKITRKPDHLLHFIDILAEDAELFPLRKLSVYPASNSRDRKIVQAIQQILTNDNTISKDLQDVVEIMTNPFMLELRTIGMEMRKKADNKITEERDFQSQQLDKQIAAEKEKLQGERAHEITLENLANEAKIEVASLNSYGRASTSDDPNANFDRIDEATQRAIQNDYTQQGIDLKIGELSRKEKLDKETVRLNAIKVKQKMEEIALRRKISNDNVNIALINP